MHEEILTEVTLSAFTIHSDAELVDEPGVRSDLNKLVTEIEALTSGGDALFATVTHRSGCIDLRLKNEMPLRDVTILCNRIKKMLKDSRAPVLTP